MCGFCNKVQSITSSTNYLAEGVTYGKFWEGDISYFFSTSATQYNYDGEAQKNFAPATTQQVNSALFTLEKAFGSAANDGFSVEGFTRATISAGDATTATLRFGQSDAPSTAYAYMPGDYEQAGDMWFGRNYDYTNAQAGNYAWQTVLHEVGHALGLKHGHEDRNGFAALPAEYDSLEYSVMTYRSYKGGEITSYSFSEWSAPQTYMMADIAALQQLYGADYSTNKNDTVYSWRPDSGDTWVNGEVGIDAGGMVIFATIWDGGGTDTYDLSGFVADLTLSLAAGSFSGFGTGQLADLGKGHFASGNIYNALMYHRDQRSLIENAIGGSGHDIIVGNATGNGLEGGAGDDDLSGKRGADQLAGGAGNDVLAGGGGEDLFIFDLAPGHDRIVDFADGVDHLSFASSVDIAAILATAHQEGADLVLSLDEVTSVTLANVDCADLGLEDFQITV